MFIQVLEFIKKKTTLILIIIMLTLNIINSHYDNIKQNQFQTSLNDFMVKYEQVMNKNDEFQKQKNDELISLAKKLIQATDKMDSTKLDIKTTIKEINNVQHQTITDNDSILFMLNHGK